MNPRHRGVNSAIISSESGVEKDDEDLATYVQFLEYSTQSIPSHLACHNNEYWPHTPLQL